MYRFSLFSKKKKDDKCPAIAVSSKKLYLKRVVFETCVYKKKCIPKRTVLFPIHSTGSQLKTTFFPETCHGRSVRTSRILFVAV